VENPCLMPIAVTRGTPAASVASAAHTQRASDDAGSITATASHTRGTMRGSRAIRSRGCRAPPPMLLGNNVLRGIYTSAGEIAHITAVHAFPPSDDESSRVSFESRYLCRTGGRSRSSNGYMEVRATRTCAFVHVTRCVRMRTGACLRTQMRRCVQGGAVVCVRDVLLLAGLALLRERHDNLPHSRADVARASPVLAQIRQG